MYTNLLTKWIIKSLGIPPVLKFRKEPTNLLCGWCLWSLLLLLHVQQKKKNNKIGEQICNPQVIEGWLTTLIIIGVGDEPVLCSGLGGPRHRIYFLLGITHFCAWKKRRIKMCIYYIFFSHIRLTKRFKRVHRHNVYISMAGSSCCLCM